MFEVRCTIVAETFSSDSMSFLWRSSTESCTWLIRLGMLLHWLSWYQYSSAKEKYSPFPLIYLSCLFLLWHKCCLAGTNVDWRGSHVSKGLWVDWACACPLVPLSLLWGCSVSWEQRSGVQLAFSTNDVITPQGALAGQSSRAAADHILMGSLLCHALSLCIVTGRLAKDAFCISNYTASWLEIFTDV